jgi:myo-inositol-1(or 4)-monophosphatase
MDSLSEVDRPEDLAVAIRAARAAGDIVADYATTAGAPAATQKSHPNDIVTEADVDAQNRIVRELQAEFPDDGFVGEESLDAEAQSDRYWIIDPIDGTSNFERNLGYFSASIALYDGGKPALGVVHSPEPALDELFFACRGSGAYRLSAGDPERIEVSGRSSLSSAMVLVNVSDRDRHLRAGDLGLVEAVMDRGAKFRRIGSAALDLSLVAAGRADAMLDRSLHEWDFAAGRVILSEAGGTVAARAIGASEYAVVGCTPELRAPLEGVLEQFRPDR